MPSNTAGGASAARRAKNVGWRIDYQLVTPKLAATIREATIFPEPKFSDHAPYLVDYAWPGFRA